MESKTKGVYCADVIVKAIPISMNSKLPKVLKTLENIPIALDNNSKVINEYFIKRVIKKENICKYKINYEIIIKKYLSGLCYNINK
jgi:predicted transglutaminase-like protease